MLRFEWTAFVTPGVIARIASEMGVQESVIAETGPVVASILSRVGGLPFIESEPNADERTAHSMLLLAEAASHTLAEYGATRNNFGYITTQSAGTTYQSRVRAQIKVNVNSADGQEIGTLPDLNRELVEEILTERRKAGRFTNLKGLERRVKGIGVIKARAMEHVVAFDDTQDSRRITLGDRGAFGSNLRALMSLQPDSDSSAAARRTLEMILTSCSSNPHPATAQSRIREGRRPEASASRTAEWVGELWSDDYWKDLPGLIASALLTIDVCMFHIAAPNVTHPTFVLMDALKKAHERGVKVRVLLDRDGKADPYLSTIINSDARRFFTEAGIACRFDSSARLLHSKYLVLDTKLAVIGSHNWSAGSYFGFDDLTLAISSAEFAADLSARFELQWSVGT